jgi:hypothetical protein
MPKTGAGILDHKHKCKISHLKRGASPRLVSQAFGLAQMPDINKNQNGIISQITSEKLVCQGFGTLKACKTSHVIDKVRSSYKDYIPKRVQLCLMLKIKET